MKKGFTLVEVIAAIAIFSITMVSISAAFSLSLNVRNKDNTKIETMNYAEALIQKSKADSLSNLENLSNKSYYIYFDSIQDLSDDFTDLLNNGTFVSGTDNSTNYPTNSGKTYGAFIIIKKETNNQIDSYHIYIRVWSLSKKSNGESTADFYKSR